MDMAEPRRTLSDDAQSLIFSGVERTKESTEATAAELRERLQGTSKQVTTRLTTDLPLELDERLAIACVKLKCPKSKFAREAIEEALRVLGY
jgi:hypothetical protein